MGMNRSTSMMVTDTTLTVMGKSGLLSMAMAMRK